MKTTKTIAAPVALTALVIAGVAAAAEDYSDHKAVLAYAEYITAPDSDEAGGITVYQHDLGNGQLGSDFVYGDPRRALFNGGYPGVNYSVDDTLVSADPNLTDQAYWMRQSVNAWTDQTCSTTGVIEVPHNGSVGVVENYFNTGGVIAPTWGSDLTQVGFRDSTNFAYFAPGSNVLGVTFTLIWTDANGPTDIDNNGKTDVAFREIYYNDNYNWSDNGGPGIDLPTVAIHEVGHGLSAAHFGLIAVKDGYLFAKPRAIMNAVYGGTLRDLTGRDVAEHCANWAQWPMN